MDLVSGFNLATLSHDGKIDWLEVKTLYFAFPFFMPSRNNIYLQFISLLLAYTVRASSMTYHVKWFLQMLNASNYDIA